MFDISMERVVTTLTGPQMKALRMLAVGWEIVHQNGDSYTANTTRFQGSTLHSLEKAGLAMRFVLEPGAAQTHAYRATEAGLRAADLL